MNDDQLRLSDAEREQAAAALGDHYAEGRLTTDEHAERLDRIWAARTRADLAPVFRDLPGPGTPQRSAGTERGRGTTYWSGGLRRGRIPGPFFVVLAALIVITVLTHLPFVLFGLLVWFFVVGRHRRYRHFRDYGTYGHYGRGWAPRG